MPDIETLPDDQDLSWGEMIEKNNPREPLPFDWTASGCTAGASPIEQFLRALIQNPARVVSKEFDQCRNETTLRLRGSIEWQSTTSRGNWVTSKRIARSGSRQRVHVTLHRSYSFTRMLLRQQSVMSIILPCPRHGR